MSSIGRIVVLVSVALFLSASAQGNIIPNGDVETDDGGGAPADWSTHDPSPDVDLVWDTGASVSPTHSLLIDDRDQEPAGGGVGMGWWVSAKGAIPGGATELDLSWQQRHEDISNEFFVTLRFWNPAGDGFMGESNFGIPQGTNLDWVARNETVAVVAGAGNVDLVIRSVGAGFTGLGTGKLWVDDVSIVPEPASALVALAGLSLFAVRRRRCRG